MDNLLGESVCVDIQTNYKKYMVLDNVYLFNIFICVDPCTLYYFIEKSRL